MAPVPESVYVQANLYSFTAGWFLPNAISIAHCLNYG